MATQITSPHTQLTQHEWQQFQKLSSEERKRMTTYDVWRTKEGIAYVIRQDGPGVLRLTEKDETYKVSVVYTDKTVDEDGGWTKFVTMCSILGKNKQDASLAALQMVAATRPDCTILSAHVIV